jgi:hypothetical protein
LNLIVLIKKIKVRKLLARAIRVNFRWLFVAALVIKVYCAVSFGVFSVHDLWKLYFPLK